MNIAMKTFHLRIKHKTVGKKEKNSRKTRVTFDRAFVDNSQRDSQPHTTT